MYNLLEYIVMENALALIRELSGLITIVFKVARKSN